jgi:hypothetical protein
MARSFDMGGDRNYAALSPADKDAHDFLGWVISKDSDAAHAARYLRRTAPDRFTKAIASWKAGRAQDVLAALVAMAAAARNHTTH